MVHRNNRFYFVDGKLVKQETVKEERLFLGNDCKK